MFPGALDGAPLNAKLLKLANTGAVNGKPAFGPVVGAPELKLSDSNPLEPDMSAAPGSRSDTPYYTTKLNPHVL